MLGFEIAGTAHVLNESDQAVEKTTDVEQPDGFIVKCQLLPCERLEELVQCAKTTGQRDETITEIDHHLLALVHAYHNAQFGKATMSKLLFHECSRDDADDLAILRERPVRHGTHEADAAASIDESDATAGQEGSEIMGSGVECRIFSGVGAAIDADSAQVRHDVMMNEFPHAAKACMHASFPVNSTS